MDNAASFGLAECQHHVGEEPAALGLGARLARDLNAYVVAPDLLGHGKSDHMAGGMYDCSIWTLQLLKFTLHIGWHNEASPFAVVGHSMDQELMCYFAASFPELFCGVVMLDGCGPWVNAETEEGRKEQQQPDDLPVSAIAYFRQGAEDWLKKDAQANSPREHPSMETFVEARMKNKFSPAGVSRHAAAALVRRGTTITDTGAVRHSHDGRAAVPELRMNSEKVACEFISKMPRTLCLMAKKGIKGGPRHFLKHRGHLFPDLTVKWADGGHHFHLDEPGPVAALVADFLRPVLPSEPKRQAFL
jgi:pimeloyl-ACP methyl ester carboxylesterase